MTRGRSVLTLLLVAFALVSVLGHMPTAALADIEPGWVVSVKTPHERDKEVAEVVRVVHEK